MLLGVMATASMLKAVFFTGVTPHNRKTKRKQLNSSEKLSDLWTIQRESIDIRSNLFANQIPVLSIRFDINNVYKKVLLRERKRHTARRVVSTHSVLLPWLPPPQLTPPQLTDPPPQLTDSPPQVWTN